MEKYNTYMPGELRLVAETVGGEGGVSYSLLHLDLDHLTMETTTEAATTTTDLGQGRQFIVTGHSGDCKIRDIR